MTGADREFAERLVQEGIVSREHAQECLAVLEQYRAAGVEPLPKLGDLLRRKGYLNQDAEDQTLRVARPAPGTTAPPLEVVRLLQDPANDLGKFVKVSLLGRGGTAEVWKAWEKELGRYVALKFIRSAGDEDEKRFVREAQLVAQLQHPNIAQVYEIGRHQGQTFLVMQLIPGTTIDHAKMDLRQILRAIRDAANALDYAHQQGIVHRDVKPSNIMVAGDRVFVMDFGLARQTQMDSSLSRSGMISGTPQYMSPEQARGYPTGVDARTDVYSLGATLYTLLCRRPPHQDEDLMTLLQKVVNQDPMPPRKLNPAIPRDVETIILKAMEKERDRRYQTARELAEDIQRFLDGEPVRARRASVFYRVRRKLAKHRWAAMGLGAAVLVAAAFGSYVGLQEILRRAQFEAAVGEAREREAAQQWEQAIAAYERAATLDRQAGWVREKREDIQRRVSEQRAALARQKAVKEAEVVYEQAARELYVLRLKAYRKDYRIREFEDYERLDRRCLQQMTTSGESGLGWWVVGRVRHVLGNRTEAEKAYRSGLRIEPGHELCRLYLARLLMERALVTRFTTLLASRQREAQKQAEEALRLLEGVAKPDSLSELELDLIKGYQKVVKKEPVEDYCNQMLQKWEGQDFWEEFLLIRGLGTGSVEAEVTRLLAYRPGWHEAYFWRAAARQTTGDLSRAIDDYTKAIEINPRYSEAFNHRGLARRDRGDLPGAMQDLTRAIEIDPQYAGAYTNRGTVRETLGDLPGAVEDYTRALQIDPHFTEAYVSRGIARQRIGDFKGAVEDHTRTIELHPDVAQMYYNRAVARHSSGDLTGAIEDYTQAIKINPQYAEAYNNRGVARRSSGDVTGAVGDYTRAIELNPQYAEAYNNRGWARHNLGDLQGAIEDYGRALQINPRLVEARVNRAFGYEALAEQDRERAREHLKTAVAELTEALQDAPETWTHRLRVQEVLERLRQRLERTQNQF